MQVTEYTPLNVRLSLGTAILLELMRGKLEVNPTTAYLMLFSKDKCSATCSFCPQAKNSRSSIEFLSRVSWPTYQISQVLTALVKTAKQKKVERVCIQSHNNPDMLTTIEVIVKKIKKVLDVDISVSCQPENLENMVRLKAAGVERIGIALDGATKAVFNNVKSGCNNWEHRFRLFDYALTVFGKGNVVSHLIIGLGETEREAVEIVQHCVNLGVIPALFAFTPVPGTALENSLPPKVGTYRRVQLAMYLIIERKTNLKNMIFTTVGQIANFGLPFEDIKPLIKFGEAFETSGCPHCNRPFYNESVRGPTYNYPRALTEEEVEKIQKELGY